MSKLKEMDQKAGYYLMAIIRLSCIAVGIFIFTWSLSRLIDKSPMLIQSNIVTTQNVYWYALSLFTVFPAIMAIFFTYLLRNLSKPKAFGLFFCSIIMFILVGNV